MPCILTYFPCFYVERDVIRTPRGDHRAPKKCILRELLCFVLQELKICSGLVLRSVFRLVEQVYSSESGAKATSLGVSQAI